MENKKQENKAENRISGRSVDIDYNNTLDFFNSRGVDKKLEHKYNYVLFQDDNPELAILRDKQEKEKIGALLEWTRDETVLDIGCGVGRWGEEILSKGLNYVGVDYSENLLKIAEDNLKAYSNKTLLHASFQEFSQTLLQNKINIKFDKIFINGVMMYLNDTDLQKGLEDVLDSCAEHCELYLKESMGVEKRLTLSDFYSDSLSHNYTAIYRSIAEYKELFQANFIEHGFTVISEGALFEENLQNRKETLDYYFILKR